MRSLRRICRDPLLINRGTFEAAEVPFQQADMHRVNIVCEEEILDNYETLLGYEPPRYYYEDDAGNELRYISQDITAGHTHEIRYYY